MSRSSGAVPSSVTDSHALSGDAASYQSALANFSVFPGLKSFAQSLTAQSKPSVSGPSSQTSPQPQPDSPSSSSNSDIEKLERLKKEILEGQNPIYKAVPQPRFLEKLYLGRSVQRQNSVPAHPDQITKSPPSSTGQPRPSFSSDSARTDDDVGSPRKVDSIRENANADVESTPAASPNGLEKSAQESELARPEEKSLAIASPQDKAKVPPSNPRDSGSSSAQGPGDHKPPSPNVPDYASQEKTTPSHPAAFPDSHIMTYIGPPDARASLNESALPADPPYDPKESLRHLENSSIWSDDRYRHVGFTYNPDGTQFNHAHTPDVSRNGEQRRGSEWGHRYGYGYDERPYAPDSYYARRPNAASGAEATDPAYRGYDNRHSPENRVGLGFQRPVSTSSNGPYKAANELLESVKDSIEGKAVNGKGTTPVAHSLISPVSQSASNDTRLPAEAYTSPVDGNSRFAEHGGFQSFPERGRQSSQNDVSNLYAAESSKPVSLSERISDQSPIPLRDRIGIHIPLQERISTPPDDVAPLASASLENAGSRPSLQDRLSSRTDAEAPVSHESGRPADVKSIPTPLSMLRSRGADGKLPPGAPAPPSGQALQQRNTEQSIYPASSNGPQRSDMPQSRSSVSGDDPQTPYQGTPRGAFNYAHPSTDEDSDLRSASAYRGEKRFADEGRPYVYERPAFRPREASSTEDRSRPSLEAREWRERGSYPKSSYPQRPDSHPPSSSPPKPWAPNTRNGKQPQTPFAEGERRPPPRSWDRPDPGYTRPPAEAYPPPPDEYVHDGYPPPPPPHDFRERPRIRGRSPSPPVRRGTYGGPPADFRPAKRVRDEGFHDNHERRYSEYHASPPSGYYDPRTPYPLRDPHDDYPAQDVPYYDRRASDVGPPPEPPYAGRTIYPRPNPEMYNGAPPRTA